MTEENIPSQEPKAEETQTPSGQPAVVVVEKKTSGFAIAGLVCGILAILGAWIPFLNLISMPIAFVGLALAIVGFIVTRKGNRGGKGIAIAALVLSVLSLILIFGMYGGAAATASSSANATASSKTASSSATSASAEASSASSSSSKSNTASNTAEQPKREYEVTVDGVRAGTDYKGNPCAIVTFSWVNNSKESTAFAYKIYPKCFQNGVECDIAITMDIDQTGYTSEVKPGYGTTFELAYSLSDESDVTIEVGPLVNVNKELWIEQTFSLQ